MSSFILCFITIAAVADGPIGQQKREIPYTLPQLILLLDDPDHHLRSDAAFYLMEMGPTTKPAIPALTAALHEPNKYMRFDILRAIIAIDPQSEIPIPPLAGYLRDRRYAEIFPVIGQLGQGLVWPLAFGIIDQRVSQSLMILRSEIETAQYFRTYAAYVLGGLDERVAGPLLREASRDPDPKTRAAAEKALRRLQGGKR